ncbi:glutathione S-transferase [Lichenihabitans sp. Uapishka_5]|uniref:glutathione S-transferase n=1 Tax=Lichenihabitans sp. Uapishka_5 TaxID=3037302 RepID=UPI0029E7F21D|nr:glutathione S-transferase [Lichenihabitans sp. Uapishka_5]MDX7950059.1 glutathione S-transferase [Lichenihabitans sp. Uapishka_5]
MTMRLIGKLDSPFVRRVAVSLHLQGLAFVHENLSVFGDYPTFADINPVVKAPTLVLDDGTVLLDSTLILEVVERMAAPDLRLAPQDPKVFARHQRIIGLALAACEKTFQIVVEEKLRPAAKRHEPWLGRIGDQLVAAYHLLDEAVVCTTPWLSGPRLMQADITAAIAWRFTTDTLPGRLAAADHPHLTQLSADAEATEAFRAMSPA